MASTTEAPASGRVAWVGMILGLLLLVICIVTDPPGGMSEKAWSATGLALLMAVWWATEAIPIPATSLLPILLIPLLGIDTLGKATSPYASSVIFLFLGGFVIGLAMQRWNLHRRIALSILAAMGSQPRKQIAGIMIATGFLSMWVSNTATAIMMLPIGMSVADMLTSDESSPAENNRFMTAMLLAIAYAASIGGVATLIGTPPNAFLAGFLSESYGVEIGFGQWMLLGVPVAVIMMVFTWWWLTRKGFDLKAADGGHTVQQALHDLGPMGRGEKMVSVIFVLAALAWIFRPLLADFIPGLNDTSIAIAAALLLFAIPVDVKTRVFVMDWESAGKLPWGVLLLFGGGLSLSAAISSSGLALWIAENMNWVATLPGLFMMVVVIVVILGLTELTSNTATAATFLPLLGALAIAQGIPPAMLAIPAAIAASCAFMMPVATPPNAIVFGTGHMKIQSMIKAGFALNIASVVVVTCLCYLLVGAIWAS
ncbi:MAG: DASS family sodium-coupled anion symporter [Alcaligenaceae bacterium]|nr:DASS family sodium-coupled anion symporter [Alcaligenaceae bacterium]